MSFLRCVYRDHYKGFTVRIGPWACRYCWGRLGRFRNGSRWSSGWHNWRRDAERCEF